jgi:hypothetical protein
VSQDMELPSQTQALIRALNTRAVPYNRQMATPQRKVHVEVVVDKVATRQTFVPMLQTFSPNHFTTIHQGRRRYGSYESIALGTSAPPPHKSKGKVVPVLN